MEHNTKLTCTKCGSSSRIDRVGDETHCSCGNVAVDGVTARWPFVEKDKIGCAGAVTRKPIGQENSQSAKKVTALRNNRFSGSACDIVSNKAPDSGLPDVIAQSGSPSPGTHEEKPTMKEEGMSEKPKCSVKGCERKAFLKGLCQAHLEEDMGHKYVPKKKIAKHGEGKKKIVRSKEPKGKSPEKPETPQNAPSTAKLPAVEVEKYPSNHVIDKAFTPTSSSTNYTKALAQMFPAFNPKWPHETQHQWLTGFNELLRRAV